MVTWGIVEEFGGMTAMCLQRARMFRDHAGEHVPVLTFEPRASYAPVVAALRRSGHAFEGLEILNIFHYYRSASMEGRGQVPTPAPLASYRWWEVRTKRQKDDDGRVFCKVSTLRGTDTVVRREYVRKDGTTFLRDETPADQDGDAGRRQLTLLTPEGRAVGSWSRSGDFYRAWLRELSEPGPVALVVDSPYAARMVGPFEAPDAVKLGVLHSSHVVSGSDPFAGTLAQPERSIVNDPGRWDAVVFLTEGQRDDYVARFGAADNLHVVPNARERVRALPPFDERKRATGVMVCQLSQRKNVDSAIRIIQLASRDVPEVHLDVYGDGPQLPHLQDRVAQLGMHEHVTLHGHAPQAARFFETATFSLLTSHMEGQPLVLMESAGRGCPAIAYDIRYGPSSLIQDGVNGYLVREGDESGAAARVVQLARRPELARSLSEGAWESSERFGERAVVEQWQHVLDEAFARRADKLQMSDAAFTVSATTFHGSGALELEGELSWTDVPGPPIHGVIEPRLVVRRRVSGAPDFLPVDVLAREPNRLRLRIGLEQEDVAGVVPDVNKQLDLALAISGRNLSRHLRIDFGQGPEGWLPYATAHGALSVQRRSRGRRPRSRGPSAQKATNRP